ncbi:MAG: hypothetical protein MJE68_01520, partial [Proteobacteria bacterium]|nr:hypothetical protein [Pseudomonadota bacterium]
ISENKNIGGFNLADSRLRSSHTPNLTRACAPNITDQGEWFAVAFIDQAIWSCNCKWGHCFFRSVWTPVIGERISEIILHFPAKFSGYTVDLVYYSLVCPA